MSKITKNYEKSKKVPFKTAGVRSELKWHVVSGARTIPNLDLPRQTIDVDFLMRKYPYLPRDVMEKVASVRPRALIGQDTQTLMVAREVVEPDPLGLMITKTQLGWNVHEGDNGGSQEAIVNICCARLCEKVHVVRKFWNVGDKY
jgi:hypothetical protein